MRKRILLLCILCIGLAMGKAKGQTATFKALFLYNFTKNIDWPASQGSKELIITVLGDDEISAELGKIAKVKKAGNKTIKVLSVNSLKEIRQSHILFVGSAKSGLMSTLSYEQRDKPVLIVGDKSGLCKQGAGISFMTVDGKLRYEISPSSIAKHQLKVTQKIISLGIEVQ
ncbi:MULTISPECIES: YfiR family protein [unclassified Carboxylicivirga]|uniref:YfiR family protein n=1 Tax=Carboxylicivirga TaxID=1628153 RepID=UPI003D345FB3